MANLFDGQSAQRQSAPPPNQQLIQQIRQNPRAYVGQLKADPAGFLRQFGISLPDGMTDPGQIAQHLYGMPPRGMMGPGRGR